MRFALFVARRYLLARRKQVIVSVVTVIAIGGVAVGTMALVIALALMTGFSSEIQDKILGAEAHIFVHGDTILGGIADPRALADEVRRLPHVEATAPNVLDEGLLEGPLDSDRVMLRGIDPEAEARVTDLAEAMVEGRVEDLAAAAGGARPPILLGADLAARLGARVGDVVRYHSLSTQTLSPRGPVPRLRSFRVAGVFRFDMYEYDRAWALVRLEEAQSLLRLDEAVTTLKVRVDSFDHIVEAAQGVREVAAGRYLVKDLLTLNKPLFAAFKLEKLLMFIAIGLIVAVAALNIVTTLTMMVMEKSRDIGILMAMGTTSEQVTRLFQLQGLIIGLVGAALGLAGGVTAAVLLDRYRVIALDTSVYYIPYLPFRVEPLDVAVVGVLAVVISFVATVWPARRAARLDPIEALRHE